MNHEIVPYGGWQRNVRLANSESEMVISLEVGPRILSYRIHGNDNILKNYPEQIGQAHEDAWMIRGGHRLWTAPEDEKITYHWDNEAVEYREDPEDFITFVSHQREPIRITKELSVRLAPEGSQATIRHTIRNAGDEPLRLASWALTVMEPGGMEILPQPPLGSHPKDLLPNRSLILWPYTDLSDPRLHLGRKFITLMQSPDYGPIKFGLAHRCGWAAYLWADNLFIKRFHYQEGATYPDFGCNFETFTNEQMLEIETLSPLADLAPGASVGHEEIWNLFPLKEVLQLESEEALEDWLRPYLIRSGVDA